jgi:hypothetical protein
MAIPPSLERLTGRLSQPADEFLPFLSRPIYGPDTERPLESRADLDFGTRPKDRPRMCVSIWVSGIP